MKRTVFPLFLFFFLLTSMVLPTNAQIKSWEDPLPSGPCSDDYPLGPDSLFQEGVPQGEVFSFQINDSKIFPGSVNSISVYVPDQYDASKPACVYVGLDGLGYNCPTVFNNLIHKNEMPVTIAIGISPGFVPGADPEMEDPRWNRSVEFDGVSDSFCRFLIEEVFPAVEKQKTKKGLEIKLSKDPNDRCAGGGSTGGVGSFSLAWQRPDQFRRVFSAVGTYVAMRGAEEYHVLVRKTEPKPIRIFMQDGHSDQFFGDVGDWWMSNLSLKRSLEFAGYDVNWVWGTGPHSGKHGAQVFPDAMRWLWRDYPAPVTAKPNPNFSPFFNEVIPEDSRWTRTAETLGKPAAIFAAPGNAVYCVDRETGALWKLTENAQPEKLADLPPEAKSAEAFCGASGADGTVFLGGSFGIFCLKNGAAWQKFADGLNVSGLTVLANGNLYATEATTGKLWFFRADGSRQIAAENLAAPVGVGALPNGQWLDVMESGSHFGTSFRLEADGKPTVGQRIFWFHVPASEDGLGSGKCAFDADGKLYAATKLGVSVLDRNGRTRLILPSPLRGGQAFIDDLCFGGSEMRSLFILTEGQIFTRKVKPVGVPNFAPFQKLPKWGAG